MEKVFVLKKAIQNSEIKTLVDYYNLDKGKDFRPDQHSKVCQIEGNDWPKDLTQSILDRSFDNRPLIDQAFFLEKDSDSYYHIHVDTYFDQKIVDVDKKYNLLIPLEVEGKCTTVFFDNYWTGPTVKFTKKNIGRFSYYLKDANNNTSFIYDLKELLHNLQNGIYKYNGVYWPSSETFLNTVIKLIDIRSSPKNLPIVNNYKSIINFNDKPFNKKIYYKFLSNMNYDDFHGLTLDRVVEWELGDIIVFNKTQLHTVGTTHKRKLHYSIFTR